MYREIYKPGFKYFWQILLLVVGCLCAFCLPDIIGMTKYIWLYELVLLTVVCALVYFLIRKGFYVYTYEIAGEHVIIRLNVSGKLKEQILCSFRISDICGVYNISERSVKSLKKEHGIKIEYKCTGKVFNTGGNAILFKNDDSDAASILVFCPSKKFLQFLSEKSIDKPFEM